ncbi:prolyl oligopeptidase family serine peptidase [Domibacillus sp. DTU_2020_1001157_1_SI_ALB_TIR_016]|uniref:prolyl oligopeptidase family serine peptidase n=1 Tax=Domibacillus sp. DTU_2020_1001157_1_SI_ALB_TIR_016 TaxID=3077789 RepID=UPI0028E884D6|nr:prolyl oligopeptidase family serine peptidase [Domibacillus sp. DTU_2020_1001157_1_SI_ALB_TIR_016]WNS78639.1 prolyl oligopeptidase family serine peptidase [Domibacillus sp. DTU_2020_1001157_1_SI_ALB_TIR_016]
MLKDIKKTAKITLLCTLAAGTTFSFNSGVMAKEVKAQPASYQTVTEIEDWGPAITKVIVDLGRPVPVHSVTADTFNVHVQRNDSRLANPFLEEGYRKVTKAYVADKHGNPAVQTGKYAVLEMEIGPTVTLGSPMNFDMGTFLNDWNESDYTITQQKDILTPAGKVSGLVADTFTGGVRELVDDFGTGEATYDDVTLTYADYAPAEDNKKNPLIIWLHGMGEGGTDPTIPISGNKAANFASEEIQSYFDGAYVLAPQTPTFWMDGFTGFGDGTSKYEEALMSLIKDYVAKNKDIDPERILIGGDSNGGYMTMLMIRDYPEYFAAAFPTCEALKDTLISDEDIQSMKDLPIWFVAAETDTTVPVNEYVVPTYNRLTEAGATDVHLSLFDKVVDTSGLYKKADGTPYEYDGHWSWIPVYNNEVSKTIDGKTVTLMEWLADKSLDK